MQEDEFVKIEEVTPEEVLTEYAEADEDFAIQNETEGE